MSPVDSCVLLALQPRTLYARQAMLYQSLIQPTLQHVIPLTVLLPLNYMVIKRLRLAKQERKSLMQNRSSSSAYVDDLNPVIIAVVSMSVALLVLHFPLFVVKVLWVLLQLGLIVMSRTFAASYIYVINVSSILYLSNSTINIAIYFMLRKTFLNKLKGMCCARGRHQSSSNISNMREMAHTQS